MCPAVTTKNRGVCSPASMSTSPRWTWRTCPCTAMRAICADVSIGNAWSTREVSVNGTGGIVSVMASLPCNWLRVLGNAETAISLKSPCQPFSLELSNPGVCTQALNLLGFVSPGRAVCQRHVITHRVSLAPLRIGNPVTLQDRFSQPTQHASFDGAKPQPVDHQGRGFPDDFILEEELCWLAGMF